MRLKTAGWMVLAATSLAAAACGDEGGELRDVTARRRAELAGRDTTRDRPAEGDADTATRLPAFAGDTAARTALATPDSAAAASTIPISRIPRCIPDPQLWTAGAMRAPPA